MFQMDQPLMKILTKLGNFILVSFYWVLACIPVITVIPACAALFHTVTKVVRADGDGVTSDFFSSFRQALRPGVLLSVIAVAGSLLLYTCVDFGAQMMTQNIAGTAYFSIGCILSLVWAATMVCVAPVLSRFEGGVRDILRIAFYLPSRNFLSVLLMLVLLPIMLFAVDFYPVLLLIVPALYADLTCSGMEKALKKMMALQGVADALEQAAACEAQAMETPALCGEPDNFSALEQAAYMNDSDE